MDGNVPCCNHFSEENQDWHLEDLDLIQTQQLIFSTQGGIGKFLFVSFVNVKIQITEFRRDSPPPSPRRGTKWKLLTESVSVSKLKTIGSY
jgi:hypothetical protein